MFQQTFVSEAQSTGKSYTLALSMLFQVAGVCLLMLIPLVYTQRLPNAELRDMLVAPLPPAESPPVQPSRNRPHPVVKHLNTQMLIAPQEIPKQINTIHDTAPATLPSETAAVVNGRVLSGAVIDGLGDSQGNAPPAFEQSQPKQSRQPGRVRVGGNVAAANLIHQVQPVYPTLAKSARIQGAVEFTAIISKEGTIEHLQLVHGHPLLVNAAKEAVLQWKYRPTLLNGVPVEVVTEITVNFVLSQ